MLHAVRTRLRAFAEDTKGYITVEAMIVMPALLWLFGVGWVYFDVFRQQSVNQKANYVIGDMISRETDPVDADYMHSAFNLMRLLNKGTDTETSLRVSLVYYNEDQDRWQLDWSAAEGSVPQLSDGDLSSYTEKLPQVAHLDRLVLVETWDFYDPVFQVGLTPFEIRTYSFTRPRFSPQVLFASTGNGTGRSGRSGRSNGFGAGY